ncbi:hypothetical protein QCE62_00330 [Caballeronia sp. LZ033]|uniref:hypothetical protein n=1 Tax=Caballeronia sp. LZ033 TaxID=3038566 RepID=UPI002856D001|nr:hypothetical protein [Caballeronia sp. LZ033]MDR5812034.1 hypothetical protein [Caballeronia sp. LZ033]
MNRYGFKVTHTDGAVHFWYAYADAERAAWIDFAAHYAPITQVFCVALVTDEKEEEVN